MEFWPTQFPRKPNEWQNIMDRRVKKIQRDTLMLSHKIFAHTTAIIPLSATASFQSNSTNMSTEDTLDDLAEAFRKGVELKDRKYRLTTYKQCFVGTEAVDFLVSSGAAETREDAVQLGTALSEEYHLFEHVARDHGFKDEPLFYRFVDEGERGSLSKKDGKEVTWSNFLAPSSGGTHDSLLPTLPIPDFDAIPKKDVHAVSQIWPLDEYNTALLNHVHPPDWKDPLPNQGENASTYDMVVIGGGTGGLVTASGSAGVGAKVALIEENLLGGDW